MCFLSEWSRPDIFNFWIAVGTILTSILTGGLLYVAKDGFKRLLSQEASKEQLIIVGNLVKELVNEGLLIRSKSITGSSPIPFIATWNIFSFASIAFVEEKENYAVHLTVKLYETDLKKPLDNLSNPLLPPKIASSLMDLITTGVYFPVDENNDSTPRFIIGPEMGVIKNDVSVSKMQIKGGFNSWLQICKNIQTQIVDWYKENGVEAINPFALQTIRE